MATAEAGLELPIGLTEQKFMQQLARIEARAIKASNGMAKKFANDNKAIADTFKSAGDSAETFTRELDAMRAKFDPMYAASKKYEAALGDLDRAYKMGAISSEQHAENLEKLNAEYKKVALAADKSAQEQADAQRQAAAAAKELGDEMERLRTRFDPVYATSRRYEAALDELTRAHKLGAVNSKQYEAALERLNSEMLSLDNSTAAAAGGMGRHAGQMQNVSYQLQDIFVQIGAGTSAAQALGQQLPQLASGFGPLGAAIGLVSALVIPLAAHFLTAGEEAASLGDAIDELEDAVSSYQSAVEAANAPLEELIEKYGRATGAARALLEQTESLMKIQAIAEMRDSVDAVGAAFDGLAEKVAVIEQAVAQGYGLGDPAAARAAESLSEQFGITADQARELYRLITDVQTAQSLDGQVVAMRALSAFMSDVAGSSSSVTAEFTQQAVAVNKAALSMTEFKAATTDAEASAISLSDAVASIDFSNPITGAQQLSGVMGTMVGQAQALLERLSAAAVAARQKIQSAVARDNPLDPLGAFSGGQGSAMRVQVGAGGVIRTPEIPAIPSGGGGGRRSRGGRRGGGGGGGGGRPETPFFEASDREIQNMQRQLELIGKTSEEVATMEARWAMLDEAKKRGITVNETLNGQIEAQAAKVGQLTAELERAEIAQQQFDEAVEGIADAFAGAILAALFLERFVDKTIPWAHLDVMAWNPSSKPGRPEGGEALGMRAVFAYLEGRYGKKS